MYIAGHTMGTPFHTPYEAIDLMAGIGLEGIELIVQNEYKCGIPEDVKKSELLSLRKKAADAGIVITGLTPYTIRYNDPDDEVRNAAISQLKRVIEYADIIGAPQVRIYGGSFGDDEIDKDNVKFNHLIASLSLLGEYAGQFGVTLVLENHPRTMCVHAAPSAKVVRAVNNQNVRILYDQANISAFFGEDYKTAVALQKDLIAYCHVKDVTFRKKAPSAKKSSSSELIISEEDRTVSPAVVGKGELPWAGILDELYKAGYDGWLSLEYETRWHPKELPPPEIGMKESADYLRGILAALKFRYGNKERI